MKIREKKIHKMYMKENKNTKVRHLKFALT